MHYLNIFRRYPDLFQILVVCTVCFAFICNGMDVFWSSPSIPALLESEIITSFDEGSYLIVSQVIGMIITIPIFSCGIDSIGRKKTILLVAVPQCLGWIITMSSKTIWPLLFARFMTGIGDTGVFTTIPIYVCEVTTPHVRSSWGNLMPISHYTGMLLVSTIGAYNSITVTSMVGLCFPLLHLAFFIWVPESPYYLLKKSKFKEAKEALQALRVQGNIDEEFSQLECNYKKQRELNGTWKDLICIKTNRNALFMCIGVKSLQHFSGLFAFKMYNQSLFQYSSVDLSPKVSSIVFSAFMLTCITVASFVVHRFGRKPLMVFSCTGCGIILGIEAIYFAMIRFTTFDQSLLYWIPLAGMLTYIIVASPGIGVIPFVFTGEIFSTTIKSKAILLNNVAVTVLLLLIPKLFQFMTEHWGLFAPFTLFACCCFIGALLVHFYVIETNGKTLEEIQQDLKKSTTK